MEYSNHFLNVTVKDEGIGISKKYQENIFTPFTQEDTSTTRKYGGTGLGLAISYNLIQLMGGEIHLQSEVSIGSEFYFSIPLQEGLSPNVTTPIQSHRNSNIDGYILLVEDNVTNQLFMKVLLKKMGLQYEIANDGLEALEMFQQQKFDLILMDENMPRMSGIEATQQIRKIEKEKNLLHTPIIALTANALQGDQEKFISAGMDEYLSKPINKELLYTILQKFLIK